MKQQTDRADHPHEVIPNQDIVTTPARTGRRRTLLLVMTAVIAVAGVGAGMKLRASRNGIGKGATFTAQCGDLTVTVTEGGSIRARNAIQYTCDVERRGGELSILSIVPAGTYVTQEDVDNGKVLVELDASTLKEQLHRAKLELAAEQEGLTSAQAAYEIQVLQNESNISDGRLKLRFAMLALQKYLGTESASLLTKDVNAVADLTEHVVPFLQQARDDPNLLDGSAAGQELQRLNDEVVLAAGNLKNAQATLTGTEKLHQVNYISDLDLERDRLNLTNRQFALKNAELNIDLFLHYDFPQGVEQYVSDYIEAWRQLQRIHAQCRSQTAHAQERLNDAQESVADEAGKVAYYQRQIEKCTIRAKAPGLVIYGSGSRGDAYSAMRGRSGSAGSGIIGPGENVYQGQVLISMPDTVSMIAEIDVHETEVDKVRPGQPAQIVMDAFPDRILHGEVLEVAPLPDEQQSFMNPDLKVYKTLVSINGTHDFLKTRMSCKVVVFIEQLRDVVLVPNQVVSNRKGRKVVYTVNERGDNEERPVKTGMFNATFVQIVEGLEQGQEVLLNPPLFMETHVPVVFKSARAPVAEPNVTVP